MLNSMFRHRMLRRLLRDEDGQDLMEYSLMVAFVALASAAIFMGAGGSINVMWTSANVTLHNAANPATSTTSDSGGHGAP